MHAIKCNRAIDGVTLVKEPEVWSSTKTALKWTNTTEISPAIQLTPIGSTLIDYNECFSELENYEDAQAEIRKAFQNPSSTEIKDEAWNKLKLIVIKLKKFWQFRNILIAISINIQSYCTFNILQ